MTKKEKKSIMEWCIRCRFRKIKGKDYYVSREGPIPTFSECLNCMYNAVKDIKVTQPESWRSDGEEGDTLSW